MGMMGMHMEMRLERQCPSCEHPLEAHEGVGRRCSAPGCTCGPVTTFGALSPGDLFHVIELSTNALWLRGARSGVSLEDGARAPFHKATAVLVRHDLAADLSTLLMRAQCEACRAVLELGAGECMDHRSKST